MPTPTLNEEDLEPEYEDSWETMDDGDFELAKTPIKARVQSTPCSPSHMKVYDATYILQYRDCPPREHVKEFFPEHYEKIEREKAQKKAEKEKLEREKAQKRAPPPEPTSRDHHLQELGRELARGSGPFISQPQEQLEPRSAWGQFANHAHADQRRNPGRGRQHQVLQLLDNKTDNPFKSSQPRDPTLQTIKSVTGILNKITPEKYDPLVNRLCEEIFQFDVHDSANDMAMSVLDNVIGLTFEKALSEPQFSDMYADICKYLCDKASDMADSTKQGSTEPPAPVALVRRLLIDRCQSEFERGGEEEENNNSSSSTSGTGATAGLTPEKLRKRRVANMKFIGELFKRSLLTEKIMHEVIQRLLFGIDKNMEHVPTAEELEVLCKLWVTVGKVLDREKAQSYIQYYFGEMDKLAQEFPDARLRFMLLDVIELRKSNWVPRRN